MVTIAEGVEFDTIAREWRCKWSPDNDKNSLVEAQKALKEVLADVKAVDGCNGVNRVVCGGCLDFKVRVCEECCAFFVWTMFCVAAVWYSTEDRKVSDSCLLNLYNVDTGNYIASCPQVWCLGGK